MASGSKASSSSWPPSPPQDEEEDEENVIYSYAPEVASTLDAAKLKNLVASPRFPLNSFCKTSSIGWVLDLTSSTPMVGER